MSDVTQGDAQAVIEAELGSAAVAPIPVEAGRVYVVTNGVGGGDGITHETLDLEGLLDTPRRKRAAVALTEPASLVAYVNEHAIPGTALFADWRALRIVAEVNGHAKGVTGWGDHRATLTLTPTPEWTRWKAKDGQLGDQQAFAEHLEDCTADITDPPAADLLELAQTFQAKVGVNFRSQNRLASGERQLVYEETIQAKAGATGQITIPEFITLRLTPFDGAEPVEMRARLRYRLNGGDLKIGFVLDRPDLVVRGAVDKILAEIESDTALTAYRGTPPQR